MQGAGRRDQRRVTDQLELDGDEEPVGRDQRNDTEQPESGQHGVNFVFGRRTWVVR